MFKVFSFIYYAGSVRGVGAGGIVSSAVSYIFIRNIAPTSQDEQKFLQFSLTSDLSPR